MKKLFIAEKPSVAKEFAKILCNKITTYDGYVQGNNNIFTWCVGHLVAMSYPEVYDESLSKWRLETLPFLPENYKYEVIKNVIKQFNIVKRLMFDEKIEEIYVCTDSGREGEYIYRLIEEVAGIPEIKRFRVWIDSQTEDEIKKGISNAKDLSFYDNLSDSAFLRAKEDYLMGINFSRLLTLSYSNKLAKMVEKQWVVIAVGRVMTCVLGMIVQRERDIRNFSKTSYYKIISRLNKDDINFELEWKVSDKSLYNNHKLLYKNNGILDEEIANKFANELSKNKSAKITSVNNKKEVKFAPLLYNLAELQNECAKSFKISPDETLKHVQEMYEKKMLTYPRTDARVLSKAIAKEIVKNLKGLVNFPKYGENVKEILEKESYKNLIKTKYVDDSKITDHYAIIPTGNGIENFSKLSLISKKIYGKILLRFLSIMYPPAEFNNLKISALIENEEFYTNVKTLTKKGYLELLENEKQDTNIVNMPKLKKGENVDLIKVFTKKGETTPPKRYTTGTIILAMENAGSLIEDEELRSQIKGSGIGTSATRAEIIKKLITNKYIEVNKKNQILKPAFMGECIAQIVANTIPELLNPKLTASWEKGLTLVATGEIDKCEYMEKLENFVKTKVNLVKKNRFKGDITNQLEKIKKFY